MGDQTCCDFPDLSVSRRRDIRPPPLPFPAFRVHALTSFLPLSPRSASPFLDELVLLFPSLRCRLSVSLKANSDPLDSISGTYLLCG